jgi:2-polyprenyl-6-methoxyphenol hydroxylase-like FAD-dependent oxidoreductase
MQRVLVVGAGPTGLTLAAVLARAGVAPHLIDRATVPPADRSRAIVIQARTLELFEQLGIVDEVTSGGLATEQANLFLPSGRRGAIRIDPAWIESRYGRIQTLPQDETERILGELVAAKGVTVERGVTLTGLTQGTTEVDVELTHADGTTRRATYDWVVGCDGAHSAVRHLSGLAFPGDTYPDECLLGDVDLDWGIPDAQVAICPSADGFMLAFPLPGVHRFRVIMVLPARGTSPDERHLSQDEFLRELTRMTPRFPERGGAPPVILASRWLTRYRLHRRGVRSYRQGRCFVGGDAAHIHSPVGAQGMNTGIQDAFNLGWKLALVAQGEADPALLDSYHDERHRVGQFLLKNTDRMFALLAGGGAIRRQLRRLMPSLGVRIVASPFVGRRIARFVSQTGIRYRESALSTDGPTARQLGPEAPCSGDRMPDVDLGGGRRLADHLHDPGHVLLLFASDSEPLVERFSAVAKEVTLRYGPLVCPVVLCSVPRPHRDAVLDERGAAHRRFGASDGAAYLIRPDGYIGWRDGECASEDLWGAIASRLRRSAAV